MDVVSGSRDPVAGAPERAPAHGANKRRRAPSWRAVLAGVLLLCALGIRLGYNASEPYHAINDAGTYNRMASMVARYGDYHTGTKPRSGAGGSRGPTAYFPPAFPYYLAIADLIDGHVRGGRTAVPPEQVEMAVTGTISVGLVGLVSFEAFGAGAGLVALGLAAVYPVMVELSGALVAENLVVMLELAAAWTMLRARRAAHPLGWIAATGVFTGLAALTHQNAALYAIPFAIAGWTILRCSAAADSGRRRPGLRALAAPVLVVAATAATIAPWTIRNAVELHTFVPISDETGITLAGTYNPRSANDPLLPYKWHLFSHVPQLHPVAHMSARYTEAQLDSILQTKAFNYIGAHPTAPLQAIGDNTLRMFELEGTYAWHASARAQSIKPTVARVGIVCFWVLCGLAIAGLFTRRARRGPWWLWAMPIVWWITVVPVNMETPRFREPIEPFLILLAACAVTTAAERLRSGLGRAPVGRRRRAPELAGDEAQLVKMVERLA